MYTLRTPAPALSPFVEHYWFVSGSAAAPLDLSVDVYVDGRADLIFPVGASYQRVVGGRATTLSRSNLDAQRRVAIRILQRGVGRTVGVRFRLGGVGPFATAPLRRFTDATPAPTEVFGPSVADLERALVREDDADRLKETLDAWFLAALQEGEAHSRFQCALDALVASGGLARVDAVAAAAGVSVRQVERLFGRFLGLPPKATGRIIRFQRALTTLMEDPGTSLADVAQGVGYFDQAHFVREFREMTGGGVPRGYRGYYPQQGPFDFAPNVVVFVQDGGGAGE